MHIIRVNDQVFVWVHAHENYPDLPAIQDSGWKVNGDQIEYEWTKGNLIVPEQLVEILCNRTAAYEDDDHQDDNAVEGTELTNMLDEVFEVESDGES